MRMRGIARAAALALTMSPLALPVAAQPGPVSSAVQNQLMGPGQERDIPWEILDYAGGFTETEIDTFHNQLANADRDEIDRNCGRVLIGNQTGYLAETVQFCELYVEVLDEDEDQAQS